MAVAKGAKFTDPNWCCIRPQHTSTLGKSFSLSRHKFDIQLDHDATIRLGPVLLDDEAPVFANLIVQGLQEYSLYRNLALFLKEVGFSSLVSVWKARI